MQLFDSFIRIIVKLTTDWSIVAEDQRKAGYNYMIRNKDAYWKMRVDYFGSVLNEQQTLAKKSLSSYVNFYSSTFATFNLALASTTFA